MLAYLDMQYPEVPVIVPICNEATKPIPCMIVGP